MSDKHTQDAQLRARLIRTMEQARGRLPAGDLALLLMNQADDALVEALGTSGATQWLHKWVADTTGTRVSQEATTGRSLIGTADMEATTHGY